MSYLFKVVCGAKTRSSGQPCRITEIYANGRCKYHGGLSTGPKTAAGKQRSAQNGFRSKPIKIEVSQQSNSSSNGPTELE